MDDTEPVTKLVSVAREGGTCCTSGEAEQFAALPEGKAHIQAEGLKAKTPPVASPAGCDQGITKIKGITKRFIDKPVCRSTHGMRMLTVLTLAGSQACVFQWCGGKAFSPHPG
jgi:hypothetical protein